MTGRPALLALLLLAMPAGGRAQAGPDPAAAPPADQGRGLWIGPIHLCRDTVSESSIVDTEDRGPFPSLIVTLRPELRAELRRETERLVGRTMPIRLDGKTITEPMVHEPLTGGELAIAGTSADETDAIQAALREAC